MNYSSIFSFDEAFSAIRQIKFKSNRFDLTKRIAE